MHSTINERNSDIDDISVNTNLKVFNGGLGLAKNHKREQNHSQQKKHEINKMQKFTKEFHDPKEKIFKEYNNINNNNNSKNTNPKFKETNLADKENLIEAEGIISFRSKKVTRNENEAENVDINVLTSGIINKIDKLHLKSNKKDARNLLPTNTNNNSNANEEHTINKIFKLNDERETEKEIKNFEKESQRIQSRILAGNPLESSSSEFSEEEFERNDGYNTHKIKRTLDDIHMKNVNKNGKYTRGVVKNGNHSNYNNDNKPINNYNKNYNTIGGDERINNLNSNVFDDSRNQNSFRNDGGDVNEKNIFWNLRGNNNANVNEDLEKSNYYHTLKRSRSAIDKEFGSGIINLFF